MLHLLAVVLLQAPDTSLKHRVELALAESPIERFDSISGNTIVQSTLQVDLDGDHTHAIAAVLRPAFRQTPTIVFFRTLGADSLERLPEGLAPGALIPVDGSQEDSHVLRVGMDFTPETHGGPFDTLGMVRTALGTGMSVVAYHSFFHADLRRGKPFFILMTDHALPPDDSLTCGEFRFADVLEAKYGHLAGGGPVNFLVVRTAGELTIYQLNGISPAGWISKRTSRRRLVEVDPHLSMLSNGMIALSADGKSEPIQAP